jgi:hypothetical protein
MVSFKVLSQHEAEGTEEIHEELYRDQNRAHFIHPEPYRLS